MLYSSLNPPATPSLDGYEWDKVNYILNNKPTTATKDDIQGAMWNYVNLGGGEVPLTSVAEDIIDDAQANGGGFVPGPDDVVAVILYPDTRETAQATIIELGPGDEGLSPGFWKNHVNCWVGYDPDDLFSDVFGVEITINSGKKDEITGPTLLEALRAKGGVNEVKGVYGALARQAVAALLNVAQPGVDYPNVEQAIIDAVKEAIENTDKSDAKPLKDMFDIYNNLGGGIDANSNPI